MIATRRFPSYAEYVYAQGGKARNSREWVLRHVEKKTDWYRRIFKTAAPHLIPGAVLCLGARSGAEVLGARAAGFPGSMGIDLWPVGDVVLQGDWHRINFPALSFINVYTNSLDHCLELPELCQQVKRQIGMEGRFYVMATYRPGQDLTRWATEVGADVLAWETPTDLAQAICEQGFVLHTSWVKKKWTHFVFEVQR